MYGPKTLLGVAQPLSLASSPSSSCALCSPAVLAFPGRGGPSNHRTFAHLVCTLFPLGLRTALHSLGLHSTITSFGTFSTPTLVAPPQMSFPEACLCYDLTSVCTMIGLVYLVPFLACEVPRERDLLAWLFQPVCLGGGAAIRTVVLTERPRVPCQF